MSERTGFEKLTLLCIVIGAAIVVFGTGAVVGSNIATAKLQKAATQNCGARFDDLTGEFAWTTCTSPSESEPAVSAPEPDPEEPVAPAETVPSVATETPSEPVH